MSNLEESRVKTAHPDPRSISHFKELEEVISHSLRKPNLTRTQTPQGFHLPKPRLENRGLKDEALLSKLVQFRDQIPLSGRIIRKREP